MSNPQLKCVQYKVNKNRSSDGNVETDNIIQKNFERIGQSLKSIREQLTQLSQQLVTLSKSSADINTKIKEIETQTLRYTTLKEDIEAELGRSYATLNEIKEVLDDHKKAIESLQGVTLMDNA